MKARSQSLEVFLGGGNRNVAAAIEIASLKPKDLPGTLRFTEAELIGERLDGCRAKKYYEYFILCSPPDILLRLTAEHIFLSAEVRPSAGPQYRLSLPSMPRSYSRLCIPYAVVWQCFQTNI